MNLFQSPNWLSSAVSSKIDSAAKEKAAEIQAEAAKYSARINAATAAANRELEERINSANIQSKESIAKEQRILEEKLHSARILADTEIARINAAANVTGSGLRVLPLVFGNTNGKSGGNNSNTPTLNASRDISTLPNSELTQEEWEKKWFKDSDINTDVSKSSPSKLNFRDPKIRSAFNSVVGASVLTGLGALTLVPFI